MEIPFGWGGGGRDMRSEMHPSGGLIYSKSNCYSDFVTNGHGESWDSSCEIK